MKRSTPRRYLRRALWIGAVSAGLSMVLPSCSDSETGPQQTGSGTNPNATESVSTPGWSTWTKRANPIYSGPYALIGDPSVIRDGEILRMFYTCYDASRSMPGPAICQATSSDGLKWTDVAKTVNSKVTGQMIATRPGKWDTAHETAFMIRYRGEYLLYFSGYQDKGGFMKSFPASLGLAVSTDGLTFQRTQDDPILKPTPRGYDNDAIFSPTIIEYDGRLLMIYVGHCWNDCPKGTGLYLLAATSTDGRQWTKRDTPIMSKADFPAEISNGAAEPELVRGVDGRYYLFISRMYGDDAHDIGIAVSSSPYGPWTIDPEPIIRRTSGAFDEVGPIAPSVLIEGSRVRMWYHGFNKKNQIQIGYAEAPWPLKTE